MKPVLILASASPQRKELLATLDVPFEVHPSTVAEEEHVEAAPNLRACALALLKAHDVAARHPGQFIIGCDTLVVAPDGTLLEKPKDEAEARDMLTRQSGGVSVVHSGLCVIAPDHTVYEGLSSSNVRFRPLSEADIAWWMHTKLWQGRSGGFQIDGPGQLMIEHIEGDWTSIVGLPVHLLGSLLTRAGYPLYLQD